MDDFGTDDVGERTIRLIRLSQTLCCIDDVSIRTLSSLASRLERNEIREQKKFLEGKDFRIRLINTQNSLKKLRNVCNHPVSISINSDNEVIEICPICREQVQGKVNVDLTFYSINGIEDGIWAFREFLNTYSQINPEAPLEEILLNKEKHFVELTKKRTTKKKKRSGKRK